MIRFLLLLLLFGGTAAAQQAPHAPVAKGGYVYQLYVPPGYDADRARRWLKALPIWAFHGDRDDVATPWGTFAMVEAIRSCGGRPRLTIYPDTGHDAWTATYDDPAFYTWLLVQVRPPAQDVR